MCGIIGVVGEGAAARGPRLAEARDRMAHRGPDSAGLLAEPGAALGFRRLAILDLSDAGAQPMTSPDGAVSLVFNGEIYNYRALRDELARDVAFRSETDSEVLLHGYQAWGGPGLLDRIDGMFAFAVWDRRAGALFAARDRLGKKPLFYAHRGGTLTFASTLPALVAALGERPAVDPAALDAYLTYRAVPAPLTIHAGVRQLEPAHALVYEPAADRLATTRYWDVSYAEKRRRSEAETLDDLDGLVRAAVRRRLVADVPLGAFLSGGVDSSLVVAMMAQEGPVEAIVAGFDEDSHDERPFARRVAERWGVTLHEHVVRPDAVADLPRIVWHYGQPHADVSIVPTYYVAAAAREHVTVVLNGDGGDELFGGYARPVVARVAAPYRRAVPGPLRRGAAAVAGGWGGRLGRPLAMLARAGGGSAEAAFVYDHGLRAHREAAYTDALADALDAHPDALYRAAWRRARATDDVDRALYGDLTTYLPDQLLTKMDVSTMAHGLEARAPLLDTALVEYAATIGTPLRLRRLTTKYLLKKLAARYVPPEVLYRRKRGFVMPTAAWLRGPLAPHLRAALLDGTFAARGWIRPAFVRRAVDEHAAGARDWSGPLWTLFVLELWARQALDGTLGPDDSLDALR